MYANLCDVYPTFVLPIMPHILEDERIPDNPDLESACYFRISASPRAGAGLTQ